MDEINAAWSVRTLLKEEKEKKYSDVCRPTALNGTPYPRKPSTVLYFSLHCYSKALLKTLKQWISTFCGVTLLSRERKKKSCRPTQVPRFFVAVVMRHESSVFIESIHSVNSVKINVPAHN